jgi:hypothetical protein
MQVSVIGKIDQHLGTASTQDVQAIAAALKARLPGCILLAHSEIVVTAPPAHALQATCLAAVRGLMSSYPQCQSMSLTVSYATDSYF